MVSCMMEDADQLTREAKALRERANTLYLQYNDAALTSETTEIQKEVTQVVDSLNQISNKLKKLMLDFEKVDPRDHPFSQKIKQSHMNYFKEKYFDHINQLMTLRGKFDSAVNSKRNQRNQTFLSVFGGQQNLEKTGDGEGEELQFAVVDLEEWYTHVLDEAQERKAQLDKLEKSLITVHSLFKDLAALVYEQSYKLNTIEDAVMSTDATITQARIELKEGIRQQKKLRKKQITTGAMVGVGAGLTALKLAVPTALPFV
jgi:t-SNARE complex subunit (syntaxin)